MSAWDGRHAKKIGAAMGEQLDRVNGRRDGDAHEPRESAPPPAAKKTEFDYWREARETKGATFRDVDAIRTDGGTQSRAAVDEQVIGDYAEGYQHFVAFPAVVVFFDGEIYWLADGFHRLKAAMKAGHPAIEVDIRQGTQREAILYSCGANSEHGLRRTNADKRRAVERLLTDEEWVNWSDREIARRWKVHHELVSNERRKLEVSGGIRQIDTRTVQRGGKTYQQNTGSIGKHDEPTPTIPALPRGTPLELVEAVDLGEVSKVEATALVHALDAQPQPRVVVLKHRIWNVEKLNILARLFNTQTAPGSNGTYEEIARTGGFHYGDDLSAWLDFRTAGIEDINGALRSLAKQHAQIEQERRRGEKHAAVRSLADAGAFSVVYADPPWQYSNSGLPGAAAQHYDTLATDDICKLLDTLDVQVTADAVLFLWTTNPLLPDALRVLESWRFAYKTNLVWVKDAPTYGKLQFYTAGQHELLLIGTRGSFLPLDVLPSVVVEPKGAHSEKPERFRRIVETMYPEQRYLELFARQQPARARWTFWGDEADASA